MRYTTATILMTLGALLAGTTKAETPSRIELRYERHERARRAVPRSEGRDSLPDGLRSPHEESHRRAARPDSHPDGHSAEGDGREAEIVERAGAAAQWVWEHHLYERGRAEYFEIGFYKGLRRAFRHPGLGSWDFQAGRDRGHHDHDALGEGLSLGRSRAEELAYERAFARAESQFRDLSREPQRQPVAEAPTFDPHLVAVSIGAPALREVFIEFPIGRHVGDPLAVHLHSGWHIYECSSWRDLYDASWFEGAGHLRHWQSAVGSRLELTVQEHKRLEQAFAVALEDHRRRSERHLRAFYERGFDRGWSYGAFVVQEWQYRQGYHHGFEDRLVEEAEAAYYRFFPALFADFYDQAFDSWDKSPRLEIVALELEDGDADGIFEPAEEVEILYAITNYGGVGTHSRLEVSGSALLEGLVLDVELPRRRQVGSESTLRARIDPRTAARTNSRVTLSVAGVAREASLYVSYPFELDRRIDLLHASALEGTAEVALWVSNKSRRPMSGTVTLVRRDGAPGDGGAPALETSIDDLPSGERRRFWFRLDGLHPLDLLGGEITLQAAVERRDRVEDRVVDRLPELAADLGNRDLLTYMVTLRSASAAEIERIQTLVLRRLVVDWTIVVDSGGNAYRGDLKRRTRRTALGDLVATYRDHEAVQGAELFTGLVPRIEELSREMPGTHPLLRKSMRKLARELDG